MERIQKAVNERLSREFIQYLFGRMVAHHTRTGIRPGCDCSFCLTKIRMTNYIGTTYKGDVLRYIPFGYEKYLDVEEIKDLVLLTRANKRKEARTLLKIEKERVL